MTNVPQVDTYVEILDAVMATSCPNLRGRANRCTYRTGWGITAEPGEPMTGYVIFCNRWLTLWERLFGDRCRGHRR